MNGEKIGFVAFHRPGRVSFIAILLLPFAVIFFALMNEGFVLLLMLIVAPVILLVNDVVSKRKVVSKVTNASSLHSALEKSGVRWLYNNKGSGCSGFNRDASNLPRTVADISLFKQINEICIPDGLTEPERLKGSIPSNVLTSIIGVVVCLLFINGLFRLTQGTAPANIKIVSWLLMPLFCSCLCLIIFGLPVFQKNKILPDFFRRLGRGKLLDKGFVVGPGWVKSGSHVWNADTDMLLIRRVGWRSAKADISCLLVSAASRKKIRFSGVNDVDFRTLIEFWNVDDVRMEFVESEIS